MNNIASKAPTFREAGADTVATEPRLHVSRFHDSKPD